MWGRRQFLAGLAASAVAGPAWARGGGSRDSVLEALADERLVREADWVGHLGGVDALSDDQWRLVRAAGALWSAEAIDRASWDDPSDPELRRHVLGLASDAGEGLLAARALLVAFLSGDGEPPTDAVDALLQGLDRPAGVGWLSFRSARARARRRGLRAEARDAVRQIDALALASGRVGADDVCLRGSAGLGMFFFAQVFAAGALIAVVGAALPATGVLLGGVVLMVLGGLGFVMLGQLLIESQEGQDRRVAMPKLDPDGVWMASVPADGRLIVVPDLLLDPTRRYSLSATGRVSLGEGLERLEPDGHPSRKGTDGDRAPGLPIGALVAWSGASVALVGAMALLPRRWSGSLMLAVNAPLEPLPEASGAFDVRVIEIGV